MRLSVFFSFRSTLLLLLIAITLAGCSKSESTIKVQDFKPKGEENAPKVDAHLPSRPPASAFVVKERNPDGTLRVRGLTHYQENHLDQEVVVSGIISFIAEDCDPNKLKDGETCVKTHFQIKDSLESPHFIQVVGYPRSFLKKVDLKVGDQHAFKALYTKQASGFVNSGDGLLKLIAIDDQEVYPSRDKK